MIMGLKACLFDMDGVIVDSAQHHFVAWQRLAEELSISFTEEDNHALKGLSRVDSLEHILRMGHLQLDEKTKVKLMDQKNAWYLDLVQGMRASDILPGAKELIEELVAKGIGVGLGSSSRNAQLILDNVGLTPLFDTVVDGNHITLSKPDPEVFEDAVSGVKAAKTGGFFAVGVGSPDQLGEADVVVAGLEGVTVDKLLAWKQES